MHETTRIDGGLDKLIFDALAEGVVWQDDHGRLIGANEAAGAILGLTHDELMGRSSRDPRWRAVREDGTPWPGEEHPSMVALRTGVSQRDALMGVITPDGRRRWIRVNAMPLHARQGDRVHGVVCSFVDVTQEVELRRHLERVNAELARLHDTGPCGHLLLDASGRIVRMNDKAKDWLAGPGRPVVDLVRLADLMDAESRDPFLRAFDRLVIGEEIDGIEVDLVRPDGGQRRVRLSATRNPVDEPAFSGASVIMDDITELFGHRLYLQSVLARQEAILDNDLVGIVRLRERRIVWTNRAFDRLFGYEAGELAGQETAVLFASRDAAEALGAQAYPVLRSGGTCRLQQDFRRKDDSTIWLDCSGTVLQAEPQEAIWFAQDITAARHAEDLRVKAAELAAENRMLAETAHLQRVFLANMSHELRTPLNAVLGFAQLLQGDPGQVDHDVLRAYVDGIEAAGRHLLAMIDSLLDASAAARGRIALQPERVDLRQAIEEVVELLAPPRAAADVTIEVSIDPMLDTVLLDPLRLRQVLLNYVGNAIKFSHRGGHVQIRAVALSDARFRIEVTDRGIGIAEADLPRLFSPFRALEAGTAPRPAGAGVGLSLVKHLVEAQGGRVGVESRVGQGSTFSALLPRVCAPVGKANATEATR